jgi:hypothetical protein
MEMNSNWPGITAFSRYVILSIFTVVGLNSNTAVASTVTIDPSNSILSVTDSTTGSAFSTYAVDGSFGITILNASIQFNNIDVTVSRTLSVLGNGNPPPVILPFDILPSMDLVYDPATMSFSGYVPCSSLIGVVCADAYYNGSFDGTTLVLSRNLIDTTGNSTTDLTLTALITPVPIPAAIWLLGVGLFSLLGIVKKKS